jgi:DNA-directed RNA polymerase, mitochondrial
MNNDYDRSLERLARSEYQRAKLSGFGTTRQGQALARQYHTRLAERINAERATGRPKHIWKALRGHENDDLALRLLIAGVSVCYAADLGSDADGQKNFRDIALWIGRNLGQKGELGFRAGAWGVDMLLSLPIFALVDGDVLDIPLTERLDAFLNDVVERGVKANPLLSPLLTPPEPWTQVRKGGLPTDHWANVPLIREHHPSIEEAARKAIGIGKMRPLLDALNGLQRVAFTINEPVLDYIKRTTDVAPTDVIVAETMAAHGRFYVPLNIDFRGRIYAIPHFNFQREDCVRALFLFADGEPIGEQGLNWLKAHIAACADGTNWSPVKKPSDFNFAKRVEWTETNLPLLRKIGEVVLCVEDDPSKIKWALPKKPYQFIAACVELIQALDKGSDFITRLPLTFDASCSGLQHLCAMTRADEGRYVNLVPNDDGDDFYRRVAFKVSENAEAARCMDGRFDRAIVKQPAMSYFYGSRKGGFTKNRAGRFRPYGMTKQVAAVLDGREDKAPKAAQLIAHEIYNSVEGMVPKAKEVRDFLEGLAMICAEKGLPLRWTTPLGLPVINRYHEPEIKIIPVSLKGRRRRTKLVVGDKPGIAKKKATNAVTANFVHSVDAAHLQFVALAADREGINLVTVHDCFGATASKAARLNEIIREEFIRLHKRHNSLVGVREIAKRDLRVKELPPVPAIGSAEIEDVLGSFHAFK